MCRRRHHDLRFAIVLGTLFDIFGCCQAKKEGENIVAWVHIPKCGTSFAATLLRYANPALPEGALLIQEGRGSVTTPDYPFAEMYKGLLWAKPNIENWGGHDEIKKAVYARFSDHFFGFFREPASLVRSAWAFLLHTNLRSPSAGASEASAYAKRLQGMATKILAGQEHGDRIVMPSDKQYDSSIVPNTQLAIDRLAGFKFVGLTDEYPLSVCLFHAMFGGECLPEEFARFEFIPSMSSPATGTSHSFENHTDPYDGPLYDAVKRIFWTNIVKFNVSLSTCAVHICPRASALFHSLLVNGTADIEIRDWPKQFRAIANGDTETFSAWLSAAKTVGDHSLEAKAGALGQTMLGLAAQYGRVDIAEILLEAGANLLAGDAKHGMQPAHHAASSGHVEVLKLLRKYHRRLKSTGSSSDQRGASPLHYAALHNHTLAVGFLVEGKLARNVNRLDNQRRTPLHLAAKAGHAAVITSLLNARADSSKKDASAQTPAMLAYDMDQSEALSKFLTLPGSTTVGAGVDMIADRAVQKGDSNMFQLLLDTGSIRLDMELGERGAGLKPLHLAAAHGHVSIAELIISRRARLEATESRMGATALMVAAFKGHRSVATKLLSHGASLHATNKRGESAQRMAKNAGHAQLAARLGSWTPGKQDL